MTLNMRYRCCASEDDECKRERDGNSIRHLNAQCGVQYDRSICRCNTMRIACILYQACTNLPTILLAWCEVYLRSRSFNWARSLETIRELTDQYPNISKQTNQKQGTGKTSNRSQKKTNWKLKIRASLNSLGQRRSSDGSSRGSSRRRYYGTSSLLLFTFNIGSGYHSISISF
jgi:hypothetical protein